MGVAEYAEAFAARCGMPAGVARALWHAGRLHDLGKVDSRFQLWLYGGDDVAQAGGQMLAKSAIPRQDAVMRRRARERAGYADSQRHELVSLDMIERSEDLRSCVETEGADWDLVLHLVASHHGWCRPLAPAAAIPASDAERVEWNVDGVVIAGTTAHERARIGSGVAARFWTLVRRYGWHELAYLEAILRLADHRRSAREQEAAS